MIHRILIKNFYSFRDTTELEFTVPKKAGARDIYFSDESGNRLNAVVAILGPNASGKTNLLKALGFLHWFIRHSVQQKPDEGLPATVFQFLPEPNPVFQLALDFSVGEKLYRYCVHCTPKRVLHESLHIKKVRFNYVFERDWNPVTNAYEAKFQDFGDATHLPLRENASLISMAVLQENPVAKELDAYFAHYYGNISQFGRDERHDPLFANILNTAQYFAANPESLTSVNRYLQGADIGLSSMEIGTAKFMTAQGKEESLPIPIGVHEVNGQSFRLRLMEESRGTQALFVLLRYILPVLQHGGVAYIDEIESGLHPHLIQALTRAFYSRATNPHRAQLVFTCHTDFLLTDLEKYQIVLVEKDRECVSHAWRLDEVQGIRSGENLHAKYHAGAYGAVPAL